MPAQTAADNRIALGVPGLDELLHGGLLSARAYVVMGAPGTGKTTLGLHFLSGARGLFIGMSAAERHVREDAASLGLNLDNTPFLDLTAEPDLFSRAETYDIFSPAEVEREPMTRAMREAIEKSDPRRIFIDGLGELNALARDSFHFNRLTQSLFRFVADRNITLLASMVHGAAARSLCDGVIQLRSSGVQRTLEITKMRGSAYTPGRHTMLITDAGIQVFVNPK